MRIGDGSFRRTRVDVEPMTACVAMALYIYNVSCDVRVVKLFKHFAGNCAPMDDLAKWCDSPYWATEMPQPTADAYLQHAIEIYGAEAAHRIETNRRGFVG